MHATDWFPTLASAAGIKIPHDLSKQLDGMDMWQHLSQNQAEKPRRLPHVLDDIFGYSAYTNDHWKYVNGSSFAGQYDTWLGDLDFEEEDPLTAFYAQEVLGSTVNDILNNRQLSINHLEKLRKQATLRCPANSEEWLREPYICEPLKAACIFDLSIDPCERYNLASIYPEKLKELEAELMSYMSGLIPSARVPFADDRCDPALHNGMWQWWDKIGTSGSVSSLSVQCEVWNICVTGFVLIVLFKFL